MRHDDKRQNPMNPANKDKNAGQWGNQIDKKTTKTNRPEITKGSKSASTKNPTNKDSHSRY